MKWTAQYKRDYNAAWSKKNKEYVRKYQLLKCGQKKKLVELYKNRPCADCGGTFEQCQLDFDHREPTTKKNSIAHMAGNSTPIREVLEEIKKCDVVCANCHRLRTRKQILRGDFK